MTAKLHRPLPVDRRIAGGIGVAQWIGDDMGGGKGDAIPAAVWLFDRDRRAGEAVGSSRPLTVGSVIVVMSVPH